MQGAVFVGDRKVELQNFPDPTPGPRDVVLEIKASGMCGSDLKFYRASADGGTAALGLGDIEGPIIGGHEPCGVVAEVGSGVTEAEAHIGQRVMVHHYHGCGVCGHCRTGWSQLCRDGFEVYGVTANGAHATHMRAPVETLVPLPETLSFETGAAISCGTGTAFGALRRCALSGRDTVAIFGQGPVGLSATQLAHAMGARVLALDISPERRALAEQFGADAVIDPASDAKGGAVEALKELTHGEGVDLAIDCSGVPAARLAAVQATRTWGTTCFVGEGDTVTLDVSPDMLRKQLTIIASWTFSSVGQRDCARFIADRAIDIDALFSHRYRLDQVTEAYELFDTQTTGKGVFLF